MVKYSFEAEDVKGEFIRVEDGTYTLTIQYEEEPKVEVLRLKEEEVASLLFCSFDPAEVDPIVLIFEIARLAQERIPIQMIP